MRRTRLNSAMAVAAVATLSVIGLQRVASASPTKEQDRAAISITSIKANANITGLVKGLAPERVGHYVVVVYVKTDRWYIHPYAQGGDGLSFAHIGGDGSWRIRTIKRDFPADWVAALVVPSDYKAPTTTENIEAIPSIGFVKKEGDGSL